MSVAPFPDVAPVQQAIPTETTSIPLVPVPTTQSSQPVKLNIIITPVVDGHFGVIGNTRPFRDNFKSVGGEFIKHPEPTWRYTADHLSDVTNLVNKILDGTIKPEKMYFNKRGKYPRDGAETTVALPSSNGTHLHLPSSGGSLALPSAALASNSNFQAIVWEGVFKPKVGMTASIRAGDITEKFPVCKVYTNDKTGVVYRADIGVAPRIDRLVPVDGKWQVWGYNPEHTVFFMA